MNAVEFVVPPSTLRWVAEAPLDRPVAVLIRHSARPPLPPGDTGYAVPLTEVGVRLAEELGRTLGARIVSLHASPLLRCVQTAEAIARGSGRPIPFVSDRLLGDPGVYVLHGDEAWSHWQARGHEGLMAHLVAAHEPLPGMARPAHAARFLVHHMLASRAEPGLRVFVTHDSLVTATAARILDVPLTKEDWPWYLEAALFWSSGEHIEARYRDRDGRHPAPLCSLDDDDVVELARRELAPVVGSDCRARFFLAGGAFKTLIHGRPPRDLDLWAPSAEDRDVLIDTLRTRGAKPLARGAFSDVFEFRDRIIDIPDKVEPATLEERLGRFDLALSAVGVEHCPGGGWRAVIHPLAHESRRTKSILLLKPLINWRHALTTLARARRYARELAFQVPGEEEREIWRTFDAQDREMQLGMLVRLEHSVGDAEGVRDEARCRLR